jgi:hypothetical protein
MNEVFSSVLYAFQICIQGSKDSVAVPAFKIQMAAERTKNDF